MIGYNNNNLDNYTKPLSLKDGISQQRAIGVFDRITSTGKSLTNTTDSLSVSRWMLSISTEFDAILETSSGEYMKLLKEILNISQQLTGFGAGAYSTNSYLNPNPISKPSNTDAINRVLDIITDIRVMVITEPSHVHKSDTAAVPDSEKTAPVQKIKSRKVFIVHGHDDAMKLEVARFVEQLGLKAIILHEQVNKGRTVIEKFEANSDVDYAIVLMSHDDIGYKKDKEGDLKPRARQNVIFELGFFMGKLGREKVCALLKDDVEQPSDITGVVYIPFASHWKFDVAKEIKASGVDIDMNNII